MEDDIGIKPGSRSATGNHLVVEYNVEHFNTTEPFLNSMNIRCECSVHQRPKGKPFGLVGGGVEENKEKKVKNK